MSRLGNIGAPAATAARSRCDFVGRQKTWYTVSGLILVICIASLLTSASTSASSSRAARSSSSRPRRRTTTSSVRRAVRTPGRQRGHRPDRPAPAGGSRPRASPPTRSPRCRQRSRRSSGCPRPTRSARRRSARAGVSEISNKAHQGLVVFLIAIVVYLSIAFEWQMALAALIALAARPPDHRRCLLAGRVRGHAGHRGRLPDDPRLLAVRHGRGLRQGPGEHRRLGTTGKLTYSQAANLAVNQTLVRSINTSLIALLPVAGLLFIGADAARRGHAEGPRRWRCSSACSPARTPRSASRRRCWSTSRSASREYQHAGQAAGRRGRQWQAPRQGQHRAGRGGHRRQSEARRRTMRTAQTVRGRRRAASVVVQQGPRQQPRRGGSRSGRGSGKKKR